MYRGPDVLKRRSELVPSGQIATHGDIAERVLLLAGSRTSYIDGREIMVDGGPSRKLMSQVPRTSMSRLASHVAN